jgi:tetratricopeptide (TPR) repeat protein
MSATSDETGTLAQALAHAAQLLRNEPSLAEAQAREILAAVPGQPEARLLLARAQYAQRRFDAAVATLSALAADQPRWAQAQLELGLMRGRLGHGEAAILALERAVALNPDLPQAWRALGDHYGGRGDSARADRAYAEHLRRSVHDPELMRAAAALADNRLPEAETLLRARLMAAPTDVAAIRMLAEVAARLGRHEDAENLLARCLELAPGFDQARHQYALVLYRANKPEAALAELTQLLEREPQHPSYRNLKAVILGRTGDYDEASRLFAGLLAQYPGNPKLWLSQGHTHKTAGRSEESIAAYRHSIALDPEFGEAWWSLANLKTFRFTAADEMAMQAQLERSDLSAEHRLHFEFALGKAREDAGDYSASFAHYARGNALRLGTVPYRADQTSQRLARAAGTFTAEFFAARSGSGDPAADPIFIVGLPRSGSTLIEQILSSHPEVEGTMELPEIISITRSLRRKAGNGADSAYTEALAALSQDELRALGEQYLARTRIQRKSGAPRFIDKMPNNFVHVGLIHLILPKARIIDARRHPLACCFSNFKQHFARGQNFTYSLEDIGRYYRDYVVLMAHYDRVLPGRVHRVIYERMVEDTEAEVRCLLDYCGLDFDPRCLRFFENERPVRTASAEQVRRPIYRDAVDQWRHYEPWLEPLRTALGPVLSSYPEVPDSLAL